MPQLIFKDIDNEIVKAPISKITLDTAENIENKKTFYLAYVSSREYHVTEQTFNSLKDNGCKVLD